MMSIADQLLANNDEMAVPRPPKKRMTEKEFLAWIDREELARAEWVDGEVIMMAPANLEHGDLNWWLLTLLKLYVQRKKLGVTTFDIFVRLIKPRRQLRVPDVVYVRESRRKIVTQKRIDGYLDLIMEIVSPDSGARDWRIKYTDYEKAGVSEYWVIDPLARQVEAYALRGSRYQRIVERGGKIKSKVVPDWYLRPARLWSEPGIDVLDALAELGVR